jgi:hypothetical protein
MRNFLLKWGSICIQYNTGSFLEVSLVSRYYLFSDCVIYTGYVILICMRHLTSGLQNGVGVTVMIMKWEYGHESLKVFRDLDVACMKLLSMDSAWGECVKPRKPRRSNQVPPERWPISKLLLQLDGNCEVAVVKSLCDIHVRRRSARSPDMQRFPFPTCYYRTYK